MQNRNSVPPTLSQVASRLEKRFNAHEAAENSYTVITDEIELAVIRRIWKACLINSKATNFEKALSEYEAQIMVRLKVNGK